MSILLYAGKNEYNLLMALMYFASDRGHKSLYANKEAISASFAYSYVEYMTGEKEDDIVIAVRNPLLSKYERDMEKKLKELADTDNYKAPQALRQSLLVLLVPRFKSTGRDSWYESEAESLLRLTDYNWTRDRLNLSVSDANEVEKDILPLWGDVIIKPVTAIAGIAQKYFNQFLTPPGRRL